MFFLDENHFLIRKKKFRNKKTPKVPENWKSSEKFRNNLNFNDLKSILLRLNFIFNRNFSEKGNPEFHLLYPREFRNFSELSQYSRNSFVLLPELFNLLTWNFINSENNQVKSAILTGTEIPVRKSFSELYEKNQKPIRILKYFLAKIGICISVRQ